MRLKISRKKQWAGAIVLIAIALVWVVNIEIVGVYPSYTTSTAVIIFSGMWLLVNQSWLSFRSIVYTIIFLPALSPAYAWLIADKDLFSLAARYLQYDRELVNKTTYLYAVAAIIYSAISAPNLKKNMRHLVSRDASIGVLAPNILIVISILTITSAFLLESGPTIISANYTDVLAGRTESSPLTAFVGVIFGGMWALLFLFGRHRKKLFWIVTTVVLIWLFLHVRRVEVFGIIIVLVLWGQYILKPRTLIILFSGFVLIQAFMGVVREVPLFKYFSGESISVSTNQTKAALPGGASNVFLAGLHLVNVRDRGFIAADDYFTIAEWPRSIIPNFIWRFLGEKDVQTEHDLIFDSLNLNYVGGMSLLSAFYLNGGVFFVVIYGMLHAVIGRYIDKVIKKQFQWNLYCGGSLKMFLITVFIIYQFRYHWYNPQTLIRAVVFSFAVYLFISLFMKWRHKENISGAQSLESPIGDL